MLIDWLRDLCRLGDWKKEGIFIFQLENLGAGSNDWF